MYVFLKKVRLINTTYVFDPALNLNQCFKNTPPLTATLNEIPELTTTWLTDLENECRKINPSLEKNIFFKHIGPDARYPFKRLLKNQLAFLYHRIIGNFNQQCSPLEKKWVEIILIALTEDIQLCTPGFHIRVNKLVHLLDVPQNLDQLLYLARKSIVQTIASYFADIVHASYQVHVVNRVHRIAKKEGLAIEPSFQNDPYKSLLSGITIREYLKNQFPIHYTAFKIPFLLAEQLEALLSQQRYCGPQETGYAIGPAEEMRDIIHIFLNDSRIETHHPFSPFFILDKVDEFGEPTRIYDINWPLIRQLFFQKLNREGYFTTEPQIVTLVDYAYYHALVPEQANLATENQCIYYYLNKNNDGELLENLDFIYNKFPEYWCKLIQNHLIVNSIDNFFSYLKQQSYCFDDKTSFFKKIRLTYILFFTQNKSTILQKIYTSTKEGIVINHNFLLKAVRYRPEIINYFFNFLFFNELNAHQLFLDLLSIQNAEGSTLLMLSGQYHAETLQFILNLLNQHIYRFEKEKIVKLFLIKQSYGHCFTSLVARYQPNTLKFILDFFQKNSVYFDKNAIEKIFNSDHYSHLNFLTLLVRYQTENEINHYLDFINQKFNDSKNKKWLELVLNDSIGDLLYWGARSYSNTLRSYLNFLYQHSHHIDPTFLLRSIFLPRSNTKRICLHAAVHQPNNLALLLQFFQENQFKWNYLAIRNLFLIQNVEGYNAFMLATHYQPKAFKLIFDFIQFQTQIFDNDTLKKIFLQQNKNGWNSLGASFNNPDSLQLILTFIANRFTQKTVKEIIFQENKNGYTCLHLAARFQPESTQTILNFIRQHIDSFYHELEQLLLIHEKDERNLLRLSLNYQPDSAIHFLNFFNDTLNYFEKLKNNAIFKQFICKTFFLIHDHAIIQKTLYLHNELFVDHFYKIAWDKKTLRYCSGFFPLKKHMNKQLESATQAFKDLLKKEFTLHDLKALKTNYPEVAHAELGQFYHPLSQLIENNFKEITSSESDCENTHRPYRL